MAEKQGTKTTFAQGQLKSIVERVERLEEEKKTISGDIKEVYAEAKANGFDTKILRLLVRLRKKEAAEREEEQSMLDVYMAAMGMIPGDAESAEFAELAKGKAGDQAPAETTLDLGGGATATVHGTGPLATAIKEAIKEAIPEAMEAPPAADGPKPLGELLSE
jgi:uncharacterized protein (UPF0335 family)